jgi:hypothetical protein
MQRAAVVLVGGAQVLVCFAGALPALGSSGGSNGGCYRQQCCSRTALWCQQHLRNAAAVWSVMFISKCEASGVTTL